MDDLDGVLAVKLNIRSRLGADLDNVCDAVAHVALVLAVAAHFGGLVFVVSMFAASSIILRATSRLDPNTVAGRGSPTNELMRHILLVLLLTQMFDVDPSLYLVLIFMLHSVSMIAPIKLPFLLRSLASNAAGAVLVNVLLVVAWLIPTVAPLVAFVFITSYLYSFVVGGRQWQRERKNDT